jgi:hypothetical protein
LLFVGNLSKSIPALGSHKGRHYFTTFTRRKAKKYVGITPAVKKLKLREMWNISENMQRLNHVTMVMVLIFIARNRRSKQPMAVGAQVPG